MLTLFALVMIARKIDFHTIAPLLKQCRWEFLLLSALSMVAGSLLTAYRWKILWNRPELAFRKYLFFVYMGYFFNSFLPSAAISDAIRVLAFGQKYGSLQQNIGVNLFARGIGFAMQVGFSVLSLIYFRRDLQKLDFFQSMKWNSLSVALAFVILVAGIGAAFFFRVKLFRQPWMLEIGRLMRNRRLLFITIILSALLQFSSIISTWLVFLSVYPEAKLWQITFFLAIIQIILILPISFGGLGAREYLCILFFSDIGGMPKDSTFAASILGYLPVLSLALAGGLWMAFRKHKLALENRSF
ncbi:MAG: lysylphosphatidylglycerol synthase transmembrane domain-containing protein [Fibrobacteria bacterium]